MSKTFNFVPGPTPIPDRINRRMAEPVLSHRSAEFSRLLERVSDNLRYLFQTQNDVLVLTASGTGAMEAAIVNLMSSGDRVVAIRAGKFGGRWVELCRTFGIDVIPVDVPWGEAVDPRQVETVLNASGSVTALLATHSETSTGVLHDIETLGKIAREHGCLFVVDSISGMGANELRPDDWNVDVVVAGSQKGLMLPPGLAFISMSTRAWEQTGKASIPSYYFSLKRAKDALLKGYTPYTPAVTLLSGLDEALAEVREIGLEAVYAHHARLAQATRAGIAALGLSLFARTPSNVLTSVALPSELNGNALLKIIKSECGVTIANGMDDYRGKVIRIAHLGYAVSPFDMLAAISALEYGLDKMGVMFDFGAGVAAVHRGLMQKR
ncbi:MAG: alanine--glyoxylate aminotransferase family protein [candidate division Zixibacteria bacterium]|nr:alanine--glyoxylate aminotransferase family protein [candidate division Zixibacteria bacterium]